MTSPSAVPRYTLSGFIGADVARVKVSPNLFIPADKTAKIYEISLTEYKNY